MFSLVIGGLLASASASASVQLLVSIKPLQLIATAIQDGAGAPDVLLPPSASPHHYALRPSDMRRLQQAQLFYWIGPDLEAFLPRLLSQRDQPTVALVELPGLSLRHFAEDEGGDHEHSHDAEHDTDEHDHEHRPGSVDGHLWLLPANARLIAARMATDLTALDPINSARYQANLAAFNGRLDVLDQHLKARLGKLADVPYFVFHEAYDYFETAYGLSHTGVFSMLEGVQPGARHVAEVRKRLQQAGPTCVFSEPPLRPRLADTLAAGLPVQLLELDPLGSKVTLGPQGYETLLSNLANGMADCLETIRLAAPR